MLEIVKCEFSFRTAVVVLLLSSTVICGKAHADVNWAQPPVLCVEEVVPKLPNRTCLDLSGVANPAVDWPLGLSAAQHSDWDKDPKALRYCRSAEIVRRENLHPGSFSEDLVETSWMLTRAPEHFAQKVAAVYEASRTDEVPAQVLTGALYQESLFSELGVAFDGGNYSCGVGQVNVQEWCRWANAQSVANKKKLKWPVGVICSELSPAFIAPFYKIALSRLNGLPEYRLSTKHFANIPFSEVVGGFSPSSSEEQARRFQALTSFVLNCSDARSGILAKGHELALLYKEFVPLGLKAKDLYPAGEKFARQCQDTGAASAFPLNLGWLIAVGAYNAGPRVLDALAYYNRWTAEQMLTESTFSDFLPQNLVESFYGAGRYDSATDQIDFLSLSGGRLRWSWMTACVLQRHIARVVQHVSQPGVELAHSLEQPYGCKQSEIDDAGHVIESAVPPARQRASGYRE